MKDILEIFAAVLAVYGAYSLICMLRDAVLYPKRVRQLVHGAVDFEGEAQMRAAADWAAALKKDGKISPERLIILMKDDIIDEDAAAHLRENGCRLIYLKETDCERSGNDSHERA